MKFWNVRKISNREYHVIETRYVNEPEYILAICTGPVPAGEIAEAMRLAERLQSGRDSLINAVGSIKQSIDMYEQELKL